MRSLCLAIVCAASLVCPARSGDQIPQPTLDRLKAATVYVRAGVGATQRTGSGFLIGCEGDRRFVVTSRHVLATRDMPADRDPIAAKPGIDVVVGSGQKNERTYRAELVAFQVIGNLALLKLVEAKDLPEPLDDTQTVQFSETLPVYILGFPSGVESSDADRSPPVTISRGTVSSFREHAVIGPMVQLNGELSPGHCGGPIVDGKGRLIGIAAVGIDGTKISFATPAKQIARLLAPRVTELKVTTDAPVDGAWPVNCTIASSDPGGRIREVAVRFASADGSLPERAPAGDDTTPELPDARSLTLERSGGTRAGTLRIPKSEASSVRYRLQVVVTFSDNVVARSEVLSTTIGAARSDVFPRTGQGRLAVGRVPFLVERTLDSKRPRANAPPVLIGEFKFDSPRTADNRIRDQRSLGCWSGDGKWLYVLGTDGIVRKLGCPGLQEAASHRTGLTYPMSLSTSSAGLVVAGHAADATPPQSRIIVLDGETLAPIRAIDGARIRFELAVSAPSSSFAYATCLSPPKLTVVDLASGSVVKTYRDDEFGFPPPKLDQPAISPDGRWIVTRDSKRLYRFRLEGPKVVFEEASPPVLQWSMQEQHAISYDGKWVRATLEKNTYGTSVDGRRGSSTHLLTLESFGKPPVALSGVESPQFAGFDRRFGRVYVNSKNRVDVFDTQGNYLGGHNLASANPSGFGRFLVHPEGRYLAFWKDNRKEAGEGLVLVELSAPNPE